MRRTLLGTLMVLMAGGVALAPSANAACHAFTVEAAPANPTEGATVEVTVTRDAAVNPSSVRLRTVDGTATAGQDYEPVDQRINFTSDVEQTLTIQTLPDDADEPDETFDLTLSEGQGCPVNTRFTYGSATVTIVDDDAAPAPTTVPPTQPPTTAAQAATTTAAPDTTTSSAPADTSTTLATDATDDEGTGEVSTTTALTADEAAASSDDGDSGSGALVAIAIVLVLAGAGAAYGVYRFRGRSA